MKKIALLGIYLLPAVVLAQGASQYSRLVTDLLNIVQGLIPVAFAAAVLFFFWGLAKYILAAGDEAAKVAGKNIMIWGVIALFVMASIWGLIALMQSIFGVGQVGSVNVPKVNP